MFEYLSFEMIKILAEKKVLIPYILLLSAAMNEFETHYTHVVTPLTVSDLEMLVDNAEDAIAILEELGHIKITKNRILVGHMVDNQFYLLCESAPQKKFETQVSSEKVTGRYVSLLRKYDVKLVELLVYINRAFHKKFGFNDTAPLVKQANCLSNVYDTSGLSLQQIFEVYSYFLDNYRKYKLDSPSIAAFNGFFASIAVDYKGKSYNTQETAIDVSVFKNFTGRK